MKFPELKIQNFLSIGEAELSLADIGLVMVCGENLDETSADSNGAGKSSLADAISWCLWGSTARGVAGDDVVNAVAGKDTVVSLTIDDNGEVYRVYRYRKHKNGKNNLCLFKQNDQGGWDDLTKGTNALTQKDVERVLGCSEEVFNAAIYSGQEQMPNIPGMTDRQLKTLVEQAAGVDVLTNAYEIARRRANDVAQKRAATQIEYDRTLQRHCDALDNLKRLSEQSTQWETDHKVKVAQLKQRTIDAKTEFELGKNDLDPAGEQKLRDDIADVEAKISAVNSERQREQLLMGDVATAEQTIATLRNKIALAERDLDAARVAVDNAEVSLENVKNGVGKPCKTCARPLEGEHLQGAITSAQQVLENAKHAHQESLEAFSFAEAKLPAAEKLLKGAQDTLAQHRASMTDVSSEAQRLANLRRELQIIERAKQEVERLREAAKNAALLWQNEQTATNPFEGMIEQANDEILEHAAKVEAAKQEAIAAKEEEQYAQAVVDVFAPAGVRAHRLDEATPYLNERTAHYLGSLSDGAIDAFWTTLTETKNKKELREKFSVTVEKKGSAPNFNALSGGEKRKVRIACALALQDLVATRATKNIELWIGDEVDDALDPAGLERLMGILEEKARDRGSVLIVSHNDIRDFARKTITVRKQGGIATVEVQ